MRSNAVRILVLCTLAGLPAVAAGPQDGYERLKWGLSVEEVLSVLERDYNNPATLEVRKRRAIESMIEEFKAANPGYPPPDTSGYDDTLDAEDFRATFEYEEISRDALRPQYFLKELGTAVEMDTGEGVIALADERPRKFFCFIEGRFWKVVEIHEDPVVKEDITFGAFVERLARRLGQPDKKEYASKPGSPRRELVLVKWKGPQTEIRAKPLFARYLVIYESVATAAQVDKIRSKMRSLKMREDSGDAPVP